MSVCFIFCFVNFIRRDSFTNLTYNLKNILLDASIALVSNSFLNPSFAGKKEPRPKSATPTSAVSRNLVPTTSICYRVLLRRSTPGFSYTMAGVADVLILLSWMLLSRICQLYMTGLARPSTFQLPPKWSYMDLAALVLMCGSMRWGLHSCLL